jgi:hypothetical protein
MLQSDESAMDFEEFDDLQAASVRRTEAVKGSKALRSMITAESEIFALFSDYRDVTVPHSMKNPAD